MVILGFHLIPGDLYFIVDAISTNSYFGEFG